jgi:hypothetical protein
MPNVVCMIGEGCLEKIVEVIGGLPRLALDVMLSSGGDLLIGVIGLLVVIALIAAGSDRDLFGSPLGPPLVAF